MCRRPVSPAKPESRPIKAQCRLVVESMLPHMAHTVRQIVAQTKYKLIAPLFAETITEKKRLLFVFKYAFVW